MLTHVYVGSSGDRLGRLGPKTVRSTDIAHVHFTVPGGEDAVRLALREKRLPPSSTDSAAVPVVADALPHLRDSEDALTFLRACSGPDGLRAFLSEWTYNAEGGLPRSLGSTLWEGQERCLNAMLEHPWLFVLKGRQVGATTLGCAYDAHHIRFGLPNARAHLFSRREDEAVELLEQAIYGLDNLPAWLQLPVVRSTTRIREYSAGAGDRRTLRAFPADRTTGRGQTCTHAHADEWSAMAWPSKTLASISPSVADKIGSCHILTTECVGPESESAAYWRRCEAGEGKHVSVFISSTARPDRDERWLEGQRRSMNSASFNREFPTSAAQALEAAGERMFSSEDLDACSTDSLGVFASQADYERRYAQFFGPKPRRHYSAGVDIGLKNDATVLTLIDCSEELIDVIGFVRLTQPSVADVQKAIEEMHRNWPRAHISIEDSGIGFPIRQGVNVPDSKLHGYNTTGLSKPRMLAELQHLIELNHLRYDPNACPELDRELRAYRLPDTALTQDCVISIAIAIAGAEHALNPSAGRILGVVRW